MDIYSLSFNDITESTLPNKKELLEEFKDNLKYVSDIVYSDYKKLGDMIIETDGLEEENISEYVFSGEKVKYYFNPIFRKSKSNFTCPVNSHVYKKGELAFIFKPLMYLPNKKEFYTIKEIKASSYEEDFFPDNIKSFDDFYYKTEHSYTLGLEEYYNFSTNIGGSIKLVKLR